MSEPQIPEVEQLYDQFQQLSATLRQGGTIGQLLNVTPDECEALYAHGHSLYQQGLYSDAFKVFSRLVMINHMDDRYVMALAGAAQQLGRYEDALQHYATVTVMRLNDPAPVFHSAECLLAMSRLADAIDSLELVLEFDPDPGTKNDYIRRARTLLPILRQRAGQTQAGPESSH